MRFRTRTQEVEAIQWTGDNLEEVRAWINTIDNDEWFATVTEDELRCHSPSSGDSVRAFSGDWLVAHIDLSPLIIGTLYTPEFTAEYEPVPDLVLRWDPLTEVIPDE